MALSVSERVPDQALAVLDRAALLANAGGDRGLAGELLALFSQEILPEAEHIAGLADAAEQRAAAHRLRGAALAIGAAEIADVSMKIEEGAAADRLGGALQRLRLALAEPLT